MLRKNKYSQWKDEDLRERLNDVCQRLRRNKATYQSLGADTPSSVVKAIKDQSDDKAAIEAALKAREVGV